MESALMPAYDPLMSNTSTLRLPALPGLSGLVLACLAATWLIWGSTYLAIKWALVSLPPFFQMGTRFMAAALVLAAWSAWRGARWPSGRQWASAAVLGALMVGGGYGFTALAQTHVSSALVVAYIAVSPALIALLNAAYGDRPTRLESAGIALGLVGVLALVQGQSFTASPAGWLMQSVACICWSLGTVWSVRGLPGGFSLKLAEGAPGWASQMACGGALLLIVSWGLGEQPVLPPDTRALLSWLYTVVAGTLIAYVAYMVLIERVSPALASSYAFVNPVIGMALGATLGGEIVSRGEWIAALVITAGVALLVMGKRR
jgi:drug/metabolite transporter (DMT)-like permease